MQKPTKVIDLPEMFTNKLRDLMRDMGVRLEEETVFTFEITDDYGNCCEARFRIDPKSGEEIIRLDT